MCYVVLSFSLRNVIAQREDRIERGGGELLVAKFLIVNISDKVCSINLSLLKFTLLKVSGETCWNMWDETGCSVDVWNLFQTQVKLVLLCSVDRALVSWLVKDHQLIY